MPLAPELENRIAAIGADDTHGASWLAREALRTVGLAVEQASGDDREAILGAARAGLAALRDVRPGMVPVRVWIERMGREIDRLAATIDDSAALRVAIVQAADAFVERSERAGTLAAQHAAERLPVGSIVGTASDSGTIREAVRLAYRQRKLRRLLVAESADPRGRSYGRELAEALAAEGVPVEVIADAAIPARIGEANRVWLGADSVLRDGSVLNGTPSLAVARAARAAGRPVEVIGESAKIDDVTDPETIAVPPGMDRVPGELLSAVVTEEGVASPPRGLPPNPPRWGEPSLSSAAGKGERPRTGRPAVPLSDSAAEGQSGPPLPLGEGWGEGEGARRPRLDDPPATLVARVAARLAARREMVAVAESAAGGKICDLLSDRPGSSAWFAGGVVAYSNQSKEQLTGVPAATIAQAGTVSADTARAMAEGARRLFRTAWGVGETGVAGPQAGRRSAKPAGLAYVAVAGPGGRSQVLEEHTGRDDRAENKLAFALAALRLLVEALAE